MRTRRRTGSYQVGRDRRAAILDAALARFAESGYHRTPMAQIATDVGLTPRGLLHHFPTKRHLMLAVVERRFDDAEAWVAGSRSDASGPVALPALLALVEHFVSQPGLLELVILLGAEAVDEESPVRAVLAERHQRGVDLLRSDLESDVAAGYLRSDVDCARLARQCVATCDGFQLDWMQSGGAFDLVAEVRTFIRETAERLSA